MKNQKLKNATILFGITLRAAALVAAVNACAPCIVTAAQRPITDFSSRQGTYCLQLDSSGNVDCTASGYHGTSCTLFVPPQPNVVGFSDPKTAIFTLVDYAGLADRLLDSALGTTLAGSPIRAGVNR